MSEKPSWTKWMVEAAASTARARAITERSSSRRDGRSSEAGRPFETGRRVKKVPTEKVQHVISPGDIIVYVWRSRDGRRARRRRSTTKPWPSCATRSGSSCGDGKRQPARPASSLNSISCCCSSRAWRSEEHTSELQSQSNLVCRLLLEKKKQKKLN